MFRKLQPKFYTDPYGSAMKSIDRSMLRLRRSFDDITEEYPADAEPAYGDDCINRTNNVRIDIQHIVRLLNSKKHDASDDILERLSCIYRQLVMTRALARKMEAPGDPSRHNIPTRITEIMCEFDRVNDESYRLAITGK